MNCAGRLVLGFVLLQGWCVVRSVPLRAQELPAQHAPQEAALAGGTRFPALELPEASAGHEMAAQSRQPSKNIFEARNCFSGVGQSDQPSLEGSAAENFRETHRFWDRENIWLFAGVGAARALDYTSTLNMRRRGRQEILLTNSVVDNHPLFAGIEAIGAGASIGVSYWLHRSDHHRLERWVSILHIGLASSGAAHNYALKTFHTVPAR